MKKIKFILFIAVSAILTSCSSDSDSSSSINEYFNYTIDGQTLSVTQWDALKSENTIEVAGQATNGMVINLRFNSQGNIGSVSSFSLSDFNVPDRDAQAYYTNESFNFNLELIDENDKTVKCTFSGKVYEDKYDLTSDFVLVEGDFEVKYIDVTPQVAGLGVYAEIAGTDFHSSSEDQSGGFFSGSDITLDSYDGGVYQIGITTNHDNSTTGTTNFNPLSSTDKVTLSKYNTTLDYFEQYDCTGTLTITSKQVGPQFTVIAGTYSFTAVNPDTSDETEVTAGTFKQVYTNY